MSLSAVKKSFKKVGQKKETPEKNDGARKFYTSLYRQNPNSKMAMTWLLLHGCFDSKKAPEILLILEMTSKISLKK
jgi:hypothetical protein